MSYDPTDCELGICGPCGACEEQMGLECRAAKDGDVTTHGSGDPDFASLLEREPEREYLVEQLASPDGTDTFTIYGPAGVVSVTTPAEKTALEAAQERIKSLEGVLVAIRAKSSWTKETSGGCLQDTRTALDEVIALIIETLDPCKPWCAMEPGHPGACEPQERES